ncbi:autotransporter domain-containing protein [Alcaligenaceae bacterium]|nr:autotransporter domain-containing protein [Alcaligenaceae bacterium]
MKLGKIVVALALALPAYPLSAIEIQPIYRPDGTHMFDIRFYEVGDGTFTVVGDTAMESTWNLSQLQKAKIAEALRYWAELITPVPGELPALVNVGSTDMPGNAAGGSDPYEIGDITMSGIQAILQGHQIDTLDYDSHGMFFMGLMNWDTLPTILPSQLPRVQGSEIDTTAVAFHELAHGLGFLNSMNLDGTIDKLRFDSELNTFDIHMRDDNGNAPKPDQLVLCASCSNPYDADSFDVRNNKGYFTGPQVERVLDGAMVGIPLRIGGVDNLDDSMSHSELKNSLMSHQSYRNYTNFLEAELAMLQDMGYGIDRRNFYGYSVYGDGKTIVNTHGFFQRDATGTAYIPGQYNTSTLGLGLHVYGSNNALLQQADLLTVGVGGAGIRVDGSANSITVNPGIKVHANGINGRGVMFAYGKDHTLIQRGDVQATGKGGIAVSFDFGNNAMGNDSVDRGPDYRGSFIHNGSTELSQELNGALVERFDLTGSLSGSAAAIFMSDNALVNNINIMRGAQIQGDIYSQYKQFDGNNQLRLTNLTFGKAADSLGQATQQVDDAFRLYYQGNIQGDNIALAALGGITSLNGDHAVNRVDVAPGAALGGSSSYTITDGANSFVNHGTVAPGNSLGRIEVKGSYAQGPTGRLVLEVDAQGAHDTLVVTDHAHLDGELIIAPLPDWYTNHWQFQSASWLQAGSSSGAFDTVTSQKFSPTLDFQAMSVGSNVYRLQGSRPAHAYSQYADNQNSRNVGNVLYGISAVAGKDMQPLFQALDFSYPDGSTVQQALNHLSPSAYSTMFSGSLYRERQITDIVKGQRYSGTTGLANTAGWQSFAATFGGKSWQNQDKGHVAYDASSYGVVLGAERQSDAWKLGVHGAASEQTVKPRDSAGTKGRTTAFSLGLHAAYAPNTEAGVHAYSQARIGLERGRMDRRLRVDSYSAHNKSDWQGWSGTLQAGVGYRWKLNDAISVGPLVGLDYTYLKRPGLSESGRDASRLDVASSHFSSLQSSLGVGSDIRLPLARGGDLHATLQLSWDRELLNNKLTQTAHFSSYSHLGFEAKNSIVSRDAMGLKGGLSYQAGDGFAIGASVAGNWYGAGQRSLTGNVNARWTF